MLIMRKWYDDSACCPAVQCVKTPWCYLVMPFVVVWYVRVSCFIVRGCAVSRRYINCDMCSVVNVYIDHLKLCVVCINGRRCVCCSECNVVSN